MTQAPLRIVAVTGDLFIQSKISELAGSLSLQATFVTDEKALKEAVDLYNPVLVVLDLASTDYDPFSCARTVKASRSPAKILGFFPHVRVDLKKRAESSGVDFIIKNSQLIASLRQILLGESVRL